MAETISTITPSSKRQREEEWVQTPHVNIDEEDQNIEEKKRHKSNYYRHILSLLEDEDEVPSQDLSSLVSTLQQELSSVPLPSNSSPPPLTITTTSSLSPTSTADSSSFHLSKEDDEGGEKDSVIRHLLQASDDELGIPNTHVLSRVHEEASDIDGDGLFVNGDVDGDEGFPLCDGLWEFEDVNANYYALLQSQLFME